MLSATVTTVTVVLEKIHRSRVESVVWKWWLKSWRFHRNEASDDAAQRGRWSCMTATRVTCPASWWRMTMQCWAVNESTRKYHTMWYQHSLTGRVTAAWLSRDGSVSTRRWLTVKQSRDEHLLLKLNVSIIQLITRWSRLRSLSTQSTWRRHACSEVSWTSTWHHVQRTFSQPLN